MAAHSTKRRADALELRLEESVFGAGLDDEDLGGAGALLGGAGEAADAGADEAAGEAAPAWVDEDDEDEAVDLRARSRSKKLRKTRAEGEIGGHDLQQRLRTQFEKLQPAAAWAQLRDEGSDEEDGEDGAAGGRRRGPSSREALLASNADFVARSGRLPTGQVDIMRLGDANQAKQSPAVVQEVQFHPSGQLLLTAGLDKTLRVFQVDGKSNPILQSVFFKDMPLHHAKFSVDGQQVFLTGRRRYFYTFDMVSGSITRTPQLIGRPEKSIERVDVTPDGKYLCFHGAQGYVIFADVTTKRVLGTVKMNGGVLATAFHPTEPTRFLSAGTQGEIYEWDTRMWRCCSRQHDQGASRTRALAFSADGEFYAAGSDMGVVNVYETVQLGSSRRPEPRAVVDNLVTGIDHIRFNADTQMMAISSRANKDALRLVHVPSFTVFSNWPSGRTPLSYVSSLDFSPQGGMLTIANDRGKALLYRIKHYDQV